MQDVFRQMGEVFYLGCFWVEIMQGWWSRSLTDAVHNHGSFFNDGWKTRQLLRLLRICFTLAVVIARVHGIIEQ